MQQKPYTLPIESKHPKTQKPPNPLPLQLLRDNLTLWTSDTTGEGEDGGESGEQA